jgi:tetratricopeptide (TPR) repeat protein
MQALRTDAPNIRYSWDWAVRTLALGDLQQFIQPLTDFFEIAGFLVMGEKAFHSAIQQHHDSAFNRTEMKALFKLWMHYMLFLVFEGQHIRAMEFLPRLEELGRSLGDPVSLGDMYHMQGIVYYYMDRKSEAMELFDQAVALYRPLDEPRRLVYALNFQGEGLSFMVRPRDALICHTEALEISQRTGERRMEALSLSHLGVAHYFLDQFDQAARCWAEAVEAFEQVGDVRDEGRTRNNLSLLYHRLGDYVRAVQYGEEAVALMAQVGDRIGEANSEETVGEAYFALGEYEKARECFEKSVEENQHLLRGVGDLASFHASLAEVDMAMGHYEEAERRLLLAEELDGERHPKEIARSLEITSRLYARTGRRDQALERIEKGIATLNQADDRLQASELLIRKASLLLDGGQIRAAGDALEQAMEILRQQNLPPLWFEAQLLKARITHAGGDKKGANQILRELHGFHRTKAQHADLHYTLWQLNHREEYARTAHEHYERLVQNTPDVEFQRRLQELGSALQKSSPAIR